MLVTAAMASSIVLSFSRQY